MIFERTAIDGVWRVGLEAHRDGRGFFARTFCSEEFAARGLVSLFEQSSISHNSRRGTLRGLHSQPDPHTETKLVRCVRGEIFDVAVDLRAGSATRGKWVSALLSPSNGVALYLAPGIAHGFQTLQDDTDVLYQITPPYVAGSGGEGVRWNDPAFNIQWPLSSPILSERDANYPDWRP